MALSARHPDEPALHHELRDAFNRELTSTNFFVWIDVRPTGTANEFAHLDQVVAATEEWLGDLDPDAAPPGEGRVNERWIIDPAAEVKMRAIPKKPDARNRRSDPIVANPEPILVGYGG